MNTFVLHWPYMFFFVRLAVCGCSGWLMPPKFCGTMYEMIIITSGFYLKIFICPRKVLFCESLWHCPFNAGVGWEGGDEWVRAQFRFYLTCLLRTSLEREKPVIHHFNRKATSPQIRIRSVSYQLSGQNADPAKHIEKEDLVLPSLDSPVQGGAGASIHALSLSWLSIPIPH